VNKEKTLKKHVLGMSGELGYDLALGMSYKIIILEKNTEHVRINLTKLITHIHYIQAQKVAAPSVTYTLRTKID
jgi:hypothetical protein